MDDHSLCGDLLAMLDDLGALRAPADDLSIDVDFDDVEPVTVREGRG